MDVRSAPSPPHSGHSPRHQGACVPGLDSLLATKPSTPNNHSAACADLGSGLTACISSIIPLHFSMPQPFWLPADTMQSPVTLPLDAAHPHRDMRVGPRLCLGSFVDTR